MNVDFGQYMKQWRFRQVMNYIAQVMEHHEIRETDDWWKFKERVNLFNKKRKTSCRASHVAVFDESMSAYVPRFVFFSLCVVLCDMKCAVGTIHKSGYTNLSTFSI